MNILTAPLRSLLVIERGFGLVTENPHMTPELALIFALFRLPCNTGAGC